LLEFDRRARTKGEIAIPVFNLDGAIAQRACQVIVTDNLKSYPAAFQVEGIRAWRLPLSARH
jgi:hypothetical protein